MPPIRPLLSRKDLEAAGRRAAIVEKFMRDCLEDARQIRDEG
jgi:hypothetical protein